MRTRLAPAACLLGLGIAGFIALSLTQGQEAKSPAPIIVPGPKPLSVTPPGRPAPAAAAQPSAKTLAIDLTRLAPLQRQMYISTRHAAGWLSEMNGRKGLFEYGLLPALNAPLEGDTVLRQAGAAFALARAARFLRDDRQAARATHAILTLLEDTVLDPPNADVRHWVLPAAVVNRLSSAALLILAIHELPAPSDELLAKAEQLCNYLRRQQQRDGSLSLNEASLSGEASDAGGEALYALMRSQQRRPAKWKLDAVRKALPYYLGYWRQHKERDSVCWHSGAYAEAYLLTKEKVFADAVFEMNDWLCGLQYEHLDPRHPRWLGGFRSSEAVGVYEPAPNIGSADCSASLAEACRVTRQLPDLARHERYSGALERCLQFLTTLQYAEADTQHFADWYRPRLIGGFYASHQDGTLRIDYTQRALSALVQYLTHVAPVR